MCYGWIPNPIVTEWWQREAPAAVVSVWGGGVRDFMGPAKPRVLIWIGFPIRNDFPSSLLGNLMVSHTGTDITMSGIFLGRLVSCKFERKSHELCCACNILCGSGTVLFESSRFEACQVKLGSNHAFKVGNSLHRVRTLIRTYQWESL